MDGFNLDSLSPQFVPVKYQGKPYVLCEASAGDVAEWRVLLIQADGGAAEMAKKTREVYEASTFLLSRSLYHVETPGTPPLNADGDLDTGKRVPLERVRAWPERITERLYDRLLDLSDLKVRETKETLEARFVEVCGKLAGWVEKPEESGQWHEWMVSEVEKALAAAPARKRESAEKNGLPTTPALSA